MMAVQFTFSSYIMDDLNNAGVTITVNGEPVISGSVIEDGDNLVATCESGREFFIDKDPINGDDDILSIYFYQFDDWTSSRFFAPFETTNNKTASLTMPDRLAEGIGSDQFYFMVSTVQALPEVEGTNNIYSIDRDILNSINKERFKVVSTVEGGNITDEIFDYGKYILNVISLPFPIPENNIALEDDVILGDWNTGVRANKVNADLLRFDMGIIDLENYSSSSKDYFMAETILHLPYLNPFNINKEYVLDSKLSIEYVLDCYSGISTANVYSNKIDSPVVSKQFTLGVKIPVANSKYGIDLLNSNIEVINDNGVKTPFIEIVKPELPLLENEFIIPIKDSGNLIGVSGYVEVENIKFSSGFTSDTQNSIENLLRGGVFIND